MFAPDLASKLYEFIANLEAVNYATARAGVAIGVFMGARLAGGSDELIERLRVGLMKRGPLS